MHTGLRIRPPYWIARRKGTMGAHYSVRVTVPAATANKCCNRPWPNCVAGKTADDIGHTSARFQTQSARATNSELQRSGVECPQEVIGCRVVPAQAPACY